jgi:hypothetical protein
MAKTKEPSPGTLNSERIKGCKMVPIKRTTPKRIKSSAPIKKGRREGKTMLNHISTPFLAALTASLGKDIRHITKKIVDKMSNSLEILEE